jgi:hypothetical protein
MSTSTAPNNPAVAALANAIRGGQPAAPTNTDPNVLTLSDLMTGRQRGQPIAPASSAKGVPRGPTGAYLPSTQKDYDALPAGAQYIRPGESSLRVKGGS